MAKRGPRTEAGKQKSALNALTHGALARTPVIPGVEDEAAWTGHLAGFRDSLAPANAVEDYLIERVASTAWRQRRLERYETEMLAHAQRNAEQEAVARILYPHGRAVSLQGTSAAAVIDERIDRLRRLIDLLIRLQTTASGELQLARDDLDLLLDGLELALTRRGPESDDLHRHLVGELSDGGSPDSAVRDFATNLAQLLRDTPGLLGETESPDPEPRAATLDFSGLLGHYPFVLVLVCARPELLRLEQAAPDLQAIISRIRGEGLLLGGAELDRTTRHEAHLRRQFVQHLHELQAMQANRHGEPAPLARLDVQIDPP